VVFAHGRAVQRNACEDTALAGPGQDFGVHQGIRLGACVTADRAGRYRGVRAERELAREQLFHAALIHDEHDYIRLGSADLQAEAAAFYANAGGSGPADVAFTPARSVTTAIFATDDKRSFLHSGNDDDAFRLVQEV